MAFVVAGANRDGLLSDLHGAVQSAIDDGTTIATFRSRFDDIVNRHGWGYNGGRNWRTRVIYDTNLRTSYAAGRFDQLQAGKARRPFWRYRHSHASSDPREQHLAWDGLILDADDSWWETHYPPNGWGCKCFVESLSARDLKRLGREGADKAPAVKWRTVMVGQQSPVKRIVTVPRGIDPGFAYAPGRVRPLVSAVKHRVENSIKHPPMISAAGVGMTLARTPALSALMEGWEDWLRQGGSKADALHVGAFSPYTIAWLKERKGLEPATATQTAIRRQVDRFRRPLKLEQGIAISEEDLRRLPEILAVPEATLFQHHRDYNDVVYVFTPSDPEQAKKKGKIIVRVNFSSRVKIGNEKRGKSILNSVHSAGIVNAGDLTEANGYELIEGEIK